MSGDHGSAGDARAIVIGVGAALFAFFVFGGLRTVGGASGPRDPLTAIPRGAFLVATIDVEQLRASPIGDALAGGAEGATSGVHAALGTSPLRRACGFDPLDRMKHVAIAVPEDGQRGAFGVAATVDVSRDELERCASAHAVARGGDDEDVVRGDARAQGSFHVLGGGGAEGGPRIAYGTGGLLVVGRDAWFDQMLRTADGPGPAAPEHAELRAAVMRGEHRARPALVVTAILPRELRQRLLDETSETGKDASMDGVLGVASAGLAVWPGRSGEDAVLVAELVCDASKACEAVEELLQRKRFELSKNLALRLVGLGRLVDGAEITRSGARVRVSTRESASVIASMIGRFLGPLGREDGRAPSPTPKPPLPPLVPDMTIEPPKRPPGATEPPTPSTPPTPPAPPKPVPPPAITPPAASAKPLAPPPHPTSEP